jgi:hypothetical protein
MTVAYSIQVTDEQNQALYWVSGAEGTPDPAQTASAYLQARNEEILNSYVQGHNLATAPVPTRDIAYGYAYGTPEQQAQVVAVLGLDQAATRADIEAKAGTFAL